MGDYEEDHNADGSVTKVHYISGGDPSGAGQGCLAAIYKETADTGTLYYAFTDYQGSLIALTNEDGIIANNNGTQQRFAYDPWGNRRDPLDWTKRITTAQNYLTDRGYTLHEHLDVFALINMNGRVYDPAIARFLSPDPLLQAPNHWLSYNRYAYCMNNPMLYTDPSGMSWFSDLWDGMWDGLNNFAEWANETDWFPSSGYISSSNLPNKVNYDINYNFTETNNYNLDLDRLSFEMEDWQLQIAWNALDIDLGLKTKGGGSFEGGLSGLGAGGYIGGSGGAGSGLGGGVDFYSGTHSLELGSAQPSPGSSSVSNNTGNIGTIAGYVAAASNTVELISKTSNTPIKYARRINGIIRSPAVLYRAQSMQLSKIARSAKFLGSALGVVSIIDHGYKAYDAYVIGDYRNMGINLLKVGADVGFMSVKVTNPYILGASIIYNVSDASGLLEY